MSIVLHREHGVVLVADPVNVTQEVTASFEDRVWQALEKLALSDPYRDRFGQYAHKGDAVAPGEHDFVEPDETVDGEDGLAKLVWHPVESSNVEAVAFVPLRRERNGPKGGGTTRGNVYVRFKHGAIYRYEDVTHQRYYALRKSASKGSYINRWRKIQDGEKVAIALSEALDYVHFEEVPMYNDIWMPLSDVDALIVAELLKAHAADYGLMLDDAGGALKYVPLPEGVKWGNPWHGAHGKFVSHKIESVDDALKSGAVTAQNKGSNFVTTAVKPPTGIAEDAGIDLSPMKLSQLAHKHGVALSSHIKAAQQLVELKNWHVSHVHLRPQGTGYQAEIWVAPDDASKPDMLYHVANFWKAKGGGTNQKVVKRGTSTYLPQVSAAPKESELPKPAQSWSDVLDQGLVKVKPGNNVEKKFADPKMQEMIGKRIDGVLGISKIGKRIISVEITADTPKSQRLTVVTTFKNMKTGAVYTRTDRFWKGQGSNAGKIMVSYGPLKVFSNEQPEQFSVGDPLSAEVKSALSNTPKAKKAWDQFKLEAVGPGSGVATKGGSREAMLRDRYEALKQSYDVVGLHIGPNSGSEQPVTWTLQNTSGTFHRIDTLTKQGLVKGELKNGKPNVDQPPIPTASGISLAKPAPQGAKTKKAGYVSMDDPEQKHFIIEALNKGWQKYCQKLGISKGSSSYKNQAIFSYENSGYDAMNGGLRENDGDLSKLSPSVRKKIEEIDEGMREVPLNEILPDGAKGLVVYRGMKVHELGTLKDVQDAVGLEYVRHGYSSTAVYKSKAWSQHPVVVKIRIPREYAGAYLAHQGGPNQGEEEFLLERGLRFRILTVNENGSRITVDVVGKATPGVNPWNTWTEQLLERARTKSGAYTPEARDRLADALVKSQSQHVASKGKDAELMAHAMYAAKLLRLQPHEVDDQAWAELDRLEDAIKDVKAGKNVPTLQALIDGTHYLEPMKQHLDEETLSRLFHLRGEAEKLKAQDVSEEEGDKALSDLGLDEMKGEAVANNEDEALKAAEYAVNDVLGDEGTNNDWFGLKLVPVGMDSVHIVLPDSPEDSGPTFSKDDAIKFLGDWYAQKKFGSPLPGIEDEPVQGPGPFVEFPDGSKPYVGQEVSNKYTGGIGKIVGFTPDGDPMVKYEGYTNPISGSIDELVPQDRPATAQGSSMDYVLGHDDKPIKVGDTVDYVLSNGGPWKEGGKVVFVDPSPADGIPEAKVMWPGETGPSLHAASSLSKGDDQGEGQWWTDATGQTLAVGDKVKDASGNLGVVVGPATKSSQKGMSYKVAVQWENGNVYDEFPDDLHKQGVDAPSETKFKVGDLVKHKHSNNLQEISKVVAVNEKKAGPQTYSLEGVAGPYAGKSAGSAVNEDYLTKYEHSLTEEQTANAAAALGKAMISGSAEAYGVYIQYAGPGQISIDGEGVPESKVWDKLVSAVGMNISNGVLDDENMPGAPEPEEAPAPAAEKAGEPHPINHLGGTTGAELWDDGNGNQIVIKHGTSQQQVSNEISAGKVYAQAAKLGGLGIPAGQPAPQKVENESGDASLVMPYVEGKALGKLTDKQKYWAHKQLMQGFALDALLANWDVLGLEHDNIVVPKDKSIPGDHDSTKPYRIDNGGAFDTKAMGAEKPYVDGWPREIWTMRESSQGKPVFGGLAFSDIVKQMAALSENAKYLAPEIENSLMRAIFTDRAAAMSELVQAAEEIVDAGGTWDEADKYLDAFTKAKKWEDVVSVEQIVDGFWQWNATKEIA